MTNTQTNTFHKTSWNERELAAAEQAKAKGWQLRKVWLSEKYSLYNTESDFVTRENELRYSSNIEDIENYLSDTKPHIFKVYKIGRKYGMSGRRKVLGKNLTESEAKRLVNSFPTSSRSMVLYTRQ